MPALPIAEVAFNLPLERSFHYLIPDAVADTLEPGMRVLAPFGARELVGVVTRRLATSPIRALKPIRRILDPIPVIGGERWTLAAWLSHYYGCSLGEALAAMVPGGLRLTTRLRQDEPSDASPVGCEASPGATPPALTRAQTEALTIVGRAIESRRYARILLQGVTGSGKTELYLQAIARVLAQGRGAICLIPEIALTPQTIDRFRSRFHERVAVWHSRLTRVLRARTWQRMSCGACPIVVGPRSAVFAPVPALGLLILDEEQEPAYKQEQSPRYHARDVACARARLVGATVVLGSATPSIESAYAAQRGDGRRLVLPERVTGQGLPRVDIIDMREELARRRRSGPLSTFLAREVEQTLERGEQVMLLLNRRGFARVAQCKTCGAVERCRACAVPLIYHASPPALVCHYCDFRRPPEDLCRACQKGSLAFRGSGTERVESELHRLFPAVAIARMDRDTTRRRESHRAVYEAVKRREVGVLVGTQMIAKGLDFPQVTLVGVVSADTALNLPDFRAGERTFDLLTQMAGRAGRGAQPGRVLIQTYCPDHYAIQAARRHDYARFYEEELAMRRRLRLPPFVHIIELTVVGSSLARVSDAAEVLASTLRRAAQHRRITLVGPAPHRIARLRRSYRVCLLLKGARVESMIELVRKALSPGRKFRGLPVLVDVDPL